MPFADDHCFIRPRRPKRDKRDKMIVLANDAFLLRAFLFEVILEQARFVFLVIGTQVLLRTFHLRRQ